MKKIAVCFAAWGDWPFCIFIFCHWLLPAESLSVTDSRRRNGSGKRACITMAHKSYPNILKTIRLLSWATVFLRAGRTVTVSGANIPFPVTGSLLSVRSYRPRQCVRPVHQISFF